MFGTPSRRVRTVVILASVVAPLTAVLVLVSAYYRPFPLHDDWSVANLVSAEEVTAGDLFKQHAQHRVFFPRLVQTLLAKSTDWNQRYEPFLNVGLALVSAVSLILLSRPRDRRATLQMAFAAFAVSIFVFSPAQTDVWLWTCILAFTMTTSLVCLTAFLLAARPRHWFAGALVCCNVAAMCSAQGLLTWLAFFPAAVWEAGERRADVRRAFVWIIAALASGLLYFHGFDTGYTASVVSPNAREPLKFLQFVLAANGAPWTTDTSVAGLVGLLQLGFFGCAVVIVARKHDPLRALALGGVGLWVFLFSAASASGRLHYGIENAVTSRYLACSAVLPAAFFVLFAILTERMRGRPSVALAASIVSLLSLVWLGTVARARDDWAAHALNKERGEICLAFSMENPDDPAPCVRLIYPFPRELMNRARDVEDAGIRTFRRSGELAEGRELQWIGQVLGTFRESDTIRVTGLVVDPALVSNPGLIVFRSSGTRVWCCGVASTDTFRGTPATPNESGALVWNAEIPAAFFENGQELTAFAYLRNPDRLARLEGVVRMPTAANGEGRRSVVSGPLPAGSASSEVVDD